MYSKDTSVIALVLLALAYALAMALAFGVYYWLLGVVHCPEDWRGTFALALTAVGSRVGVGGSKG
jgi:hypothetical protein